MHINSSFYEKLRPMLESRRVNWAAATMADVEYSLAALIGKRQRIRHKQRKGNFLSADDIAFMKESGIQIPLLFEGQAVKWAERGRRALFDKILKIEERLADSAKINPYDDILLEKLREQLEKLKSKSPPRA